MADVKKLVTGIVVDVLLLIIVFLPSLVFELGNVRPFQRGFFCDDDSIKYPYKSNTVPWVAVAIVGLSVPSITIILVEFFLERHGRRTTLEKPAKYQLTPTCSVPGFVFNCYKLIGGLLFGAAVTFTITDIIKYSVGRLRPHFLDVCRPNISSGICDGHVPGVYVYVNSFTCTLPEDHKQLDSRLSFLSGHTSVSAYCAIFFVIYLQARFVWSGSKLLRHFLQAIVVYLTVWVSMSRISDYKHHWSDVLAGAVLGCIVAILTARHVTQMFLRSSYFPAKTGPSDGSGDNAVVLNAKRVDMSEIGNIT